MDGQVTYRIGRRAVDYYSSQTRVVDRVTRDLRVTKCRHVHTVRLHAVDLVAVDQNVIARVGQGVRSDGLAVLQREAASVEHVVADDDSVARISTASADVDVTAWTGHGRAALEGEALYQSTAAHVHTRGRSDLHDLAGCSRSSLQNRGRLVGTNQTQGLVQIHTSIIRSSIHSDRITRCCQRDSRIKRGQRTCRCSRIGIITRCRGQQVTRGAIIVYIPYRTRTGRSCDRTAGGSRTSVGIRYCVGIGAQARRLVTRARVWSRTAAGADRYRS